MEVSVRTSSLLQYSCMKPKILDSSERLCTLQKQHQQHKLTSFQKVLMVSNPLSHVRLLCDFLFCLDTNSSHAHDRQCPPHQLHTKGGGDECEARGREMLPTHKLSSKPILTICAGSIFNITFGGRGFSNDGLAKIELYHQVWGKYIANLNIKLKSQLLFQMRIYLR